MSVGEGHTEHAVTNFCMCVQYSNTALQVNLHFILKLNLILALFKQLN